MKCTLIRVDNGKPFVEDAEVLNNPDGSVSFKLPNGNWAGQEPLQYGVRHFDQPGNEAPGVYQKATLSGSTVVFVTRPQDPPYVYLFGQGRAY